ncbi:MAG: hypothetical protein HQK88_15085 [Nitrospirae bacterium]|nr:hypothetical protein [Nitrospirota bacterium]MBF0618125.1 hypothetical protein [Nitrospirota bacterium]
MKKLGFDTLRGLYEDYHSELVSLCDISGDVYNTFLSKGYGATFSDVESEVLYMLIRRFKPEVVFEVSPDCGYSTHYILQALTKNNHGECYSFELSKTIRGIPTEDAICGVQHKSSDLNRLHVIIGDARLNTLKMNVSPNFVFIDSCHDDYFAEWYIKSLFPQCSGPALIHDIMCPKGTPEFSTESYYVENQLIKTKCPHVFIGDFDFFFEDERGKMSLAQRRNMYSNALFIEDCSHFKNQDFESAKDLVTEYFSNCSDAWKIQSSQVSEWKNNKELTGSNIKSKGAPVFTREQYAKIFEMFPLTFTHETLLDNSQERQSKIDVINSNINSISDLYSFVVVKPKIKDVAKYIDNTSFVTCTGDNNPVEIYYLLSNMQNPAKYYKDKGIDDTIIKNPDVATFWKLKIIESINESSQWKYEQIKPVLPEIRNSLIYNKYLALQIIAEPSLLSSIISVIFLNYNALDDKRYPILYRYITFILKKYNNYLGEELKSELQKNLLFLAENTRKAAFDSSTELLLSGQLKLSFMLYRNYTKHNRVSLKERLIYFRQIKTKIKDFLKSRLVGVFSG